MTFRLRTLLLFVTFMAVVFFVMREVAADVTGGLSLLVVVHTGFWLFVGSFVVGLPAAAFFYAVGKHAVARRVAVGAGFAFLIGALGVMMVFSPVLVGFRMVDEQVAPDGGHVARLYIARGFFFFASFEYSARVVIVEQSTGAVVAEETWWDFEGGTSLEPVALEWSDADTVLFNVSDSPYEALTVE